MKTNTDYDDSNWREDSLAYHTGFLADLLKNGPHSLSQAWIMSALKQRWKKRHGYVDPEPPDCQSSMKEWNESVKKYDKKD